MNWETITNLWRGLGLPPLTVGFVRACVEVAAMGALVAVNAYVVSLGLSPTAVIFIAGGVRTLEAAADHIDPEKNRTPTE